jgi:hypothetical protein
MIKGHEAGEICNRNGCQGIIEEEERQPCSCHTGNPPCSTCTDPRAYCEECGWNQKDEDYEVFKKVYEQREADRKFYKTVPEKLRKLFGYYI